MARQGSVDCWGFHFACLRVAVDFVLKSVDCFAELLEGGFDGRQLWGMVG